MATEEILSITPCGRCSCIELYTGENCIFCDAAEELLDDLVDSLKLSSSAYSTIEVDSDRAQFMGMEMMSIPTFRICDMTFTGLTDFESIRDAIVRIHLKPCFVLIHDESVQPPQSKSISPAFTDITVNRSD